MRRSARELLERLQAVAAGPAASPSPVAGAEEAVAAPAEGASERAAEGGRRARSLRVDVETLDRILDLTGEMAVERGRLRELLAGQTGASAVMAAEVHREADRLHADLQELVMKARMEPLGPVLRRFTRTVRDLGKTLGKPARLAIFGEDVEVDTKVVEHVRDPLVHLVRNALAHGIESTAERLAAGKDARGLISLRAFREAGAIVIEVEDDGRGLDRDRIAKRAREKGVVADGAVLGPAEIENLIFAPGFSTAADVTELSGRGVGLDVVRRNVEALRGSVGVLSRPGLGTVFTIRLPLSLSIIPGFAIGVCGETYVVPLDAVEECLQLDTPLAARDGSGLVSLRGEALPCRRLRSHFRLGGDPPAREYVVVLRHAGRRLGLVVDVLLGENQTVLKPLGRVFQGLPGLAGSAVLGSGRIALVLDLPGLFREAA
jgi:two-component system chemotaxis sensor kinase CheA